MAYECIYSMVFWSLTDMTVNCCMQKGCIKMQDFAFCIKRNIFLKFLLLLLLFCKYFCNAKVMGSIPKECNAMICQMKKQMNKIIKCVWNSM